MTRIYDKLRMACRTWIQSSNILFNMGSELEDKVDGQQSSIDNATSLSNSAITIGNTAQDTADNATTLANQALTGLDDKADTSVTDVLTNEIDAIDVRLTTVEDDLTTTMGTVESNVDRLDTIEDETVPEISETLDGCYDDYEITTNPSTVTVSMKKVVGGGEQKSVNLPVASQTQAGVINKEDYLSFLQMKTDISDLQGATITYPVDLPSNTPTQSQITTAFQTDYPTVTIVPGLKIADYDRNLAYATNNSLTWIEQIFVGTIPIARQNIVGGVKSSNSDGGVTVNIDGTMAVSGWDTVKTDITNLNTNKASTTSVTDLGTRVTSVETNKANASTVTALDTRVGTNETDISGLKTRMTNVETKNTQQDTAIAGKQATAVVRTVNIAVADWDNTTLSVSKTVTGATASNIIFVSPNPNSAIEYGKAQVRATAQNTNSVTFKCEKKPSVAIDINVVIL